MQLQNYSHNKKPTFNFLSPPVLEAKWNTKTSMKEKMMKALLGLFCFVFNWSYLFLSELAIQTSRVLSVLVHYVLFSPQSCTMILHEFSLVCIMTSLRAELSSLAQCRSTAYIALRADRVSRIFELKKYSFLRECVKREFFC